MRLAEETGVNAEGAQLVDRRLKEAKIAGYGKQYSPVLYKVFEE